MYPQRHWLGVGSGEAISDHVVGRVLAGGPERINRMFEAVEIIKKLYASGLAGKDVRHEGQYYRLESTRLWTMPAVAPLVLVAAAGPVAAKRAGRMADGLYHRGRPDRQDRLRCLQRFAEGCSRVGPRCIYHAESFACTSAGPPTDADAMTAAMTRVAEWRDALRPNSEHPVAVRARTDRQAPDPCRLRGRDAPIGADPDLHRAQIQQYLDLGFETGSTCTTPAGPQKEWLDVFRRDVLPGLKR